MSTHAKGIFTVQLTPQTPQDVSEGISLGRLTIKKQFEGDLVATSAGEMLSAGTPVKGSAGYVAIERVQGSLQGRAGSFVLQHNGTMNKGQGSLQVSIVPDSGTGALKGLSGSMAISIIEGKHLYDLEYTIVPE